MKPNANSRRRHQPLTYGNPSEQDLLAHEESCSVMSVKEGQTLFIDTRRFVVGEDRIKEHRPKHKEYLIGLRDSGKLLLAGRFSDNSGGLIILRASSMEEAIEISKKDPYVSNRLQKSEIIAWQLLYVGL